MFDITISYRERIALPPDAELDVQLIEVSPAGALEKRLSLQRFVMETVPTTISLSYDPRLIEESKTYIVSASIWSGNRQLFHTDPPQAVFGDTGTGAINIVLRSTSDAPESGAVPRTLTGVEWAVTEVFGAAWPNDAPATLVIDEDSSVSAFGGCNRFRGQATIADGTLSFSPNFAGTMMACPDPVEELERSFLNALSQVTGYVRYGAGLVMTDAQGNAVMHLVEQSE